MARNPHGRLVVTAAAALALLVTPAARGHVTVAPPFVEANVETVVRFEVPNERKGHVTTSLSVEVPDGVTLTLDTVPTGWSGTVQEGSGTWSGGRIAGGRTVRFPVAVTARTRPGPVVFRAVQGYEDGQRVRWQATLTVLPATGDEAPPQHLRRALTAGAIGLVVIAASLLALRRLRRPLQER